MLRLPSRLALAAALLLPLGPLRAADHEQSGWLAWFNTVAFNERLGLISDVQLRSRDDWEGPRNLLVRPGLSWRVAPNHALMGGYAYIGTYNAGRPDATEHRFWQQYVYSHRVARASVAQRFRLEQRLIGRPGAPDVYSDRLRWFTRAVIPLDGGGAFRRGGFMAVQNEVFLGLSGRDDLNGRVFDQNRAYVAFGWRDGNGRDYEIGYLNQWINTRGGDVINHIAQFAIYTHFQL